MTMRRPARPLSVEPALRLLQGHGLVAGDVLAIVHGGRRPIAIPGGPRVIAIDPRDLDLLTGTFGTALDLGCAADMDVPARTAHARRLAGLVDPSGFLHVASPSRRPDAGRPGGPRVPREDLAATFRKGWALLGVRDLWQGAGGAEDQHAWLTSFARVPMHRRERSAVRNFTDLGAFGSLDLGAATDRPPWGT